MIDLKTKSLPQSITINGRDFLIKTDFREWLKFSELLKSKNTLADYLYLFADEFPIGINFFEDLMKFYVNENSTPHGTSKSSDKLFDYLEDGEYIVASFMQAYHIDLTTCDMHWHMFKALFQGLPDNTKIKQIMGIRGYRKDNKSYESKCLEAKSAWSLNYNKISDEEMQDINDEFYGAIYDPNKRKK